MWGLQKKTVHLSAAVCHAKMTTVLPSHSFEYPCVAPVVCETFWGQQPGFPASKDVAQQGHLKLSINEDASRGDPPLVSYEQFPGFKC